MVRCQRHITGFVWLALVLFFAGAVIVPVVHDILHHHGGQYSIPATEGPSLAVDFEAQLDVDCVMCNTVPAATLTKTPVVFHWLQITSLEISGKPGHHPAQSISLPSRAPPAV